MKHSVNLRAAAVAAALAIAVLPSNGTIVKRASAASSESFNDPESCKDLPNLLEQLLSAGAALDGKPLVTSDTYALYYPAGSNPSAKELYEAIPESAYGPFDDKEGAISASNGWGKDTAVADQGYGEEAHASYGTEGGLPAFCRVGGMFETTPGGNKAQFEVWMPLVDDTTGKERPKSDNNAIDTKQNRPPEEHKIVSALSSFKGACADAWNKRLVFIVGGGQRGAVAYPEMKQTMARYRTAVAGTNMGHFSAQNSNKWLPGNPNGWTDWAHRAVHISNQVAQVAVEAFFGVAPNNRKGKTVLSPLGAESKEVFYTYFKGCSTGGRAAMAAAQRYPHDFDGIIAGSPAFDFNHLKAFQIHINSFLAVNTSAGYIPQEAYPLINQAVLKSCDKADGVADSVVSFPRQCKPDFSKLIGCKSLGLTPVNLKDTSQGTAKQVSTAAKPLRVSDLIESKAAPGPGLSGNPSPGKEGTAVSRKDPKTPILPRGVTSEPPVEPRKPPADATKPTTSDATTKGSEIEVPADDNSSMKAAVAKLADDKTKPDKDASGANNGKKDSNNKEDAPQCLTDTQLETLANLYKPYTIDGQLINEGVLPGSEFGWSQINAITGKYGPSPSGWFHYQVMGDKVYNEDSFDAGKDVTPALIVQGERSDPGETITFNPDLSPFFDAGGKLMHYHGLADALIPPLISSRYYEMVKKKVGNKIKDSYRLYMIPGMLHCRSGTGCFNFGGAGQVEAGSRPLRYDNKHDMFLALIDWVELSKAPTALIGAAYKNKNGGTPTSNSDDTAFGNGLRFTRPLCPYPTEARLKKGAVGDTGVASSFECA
ncbi:hypothetical protein NDA14_002820 [Ustilago hordei]|nr:hypothetical protein NDA14_002820 [Ustilago hordei]